MIKWSELSSEKTKALSLTLLTTTALFGGIFGLSTINNSSANAVDYSNDVCVKASYDKTKITAFRGFCDDKGTGNGNGGGNPVDPSTPPTTVVKDLTTRFNYNCDSDQNGILPLHGLSDDAVVTVKSADNLFDEKYNSSNFTNQSFTNSLTFKSGVDYTVTVVGGVSNIGYEIVPGYSNSDGISECLIGIDKFGNDSGIINLNNLGNPKFTEIPNSIPSSVTNIEGLFMNSPRFNNPNIKSWDTKNITNMKELFSDNTIFNQDVSSWNTSNVTDMSGLFLNNVNFNQPLNTWDTSKVTTMRNLFGRTELFNQPLNNWDTSKVTDMYNMFGNARSFNHPLDKWDTSKVENMDKMFNKTSSFDQDLSGWNVSKVLIINPSLGDFIFQFQNLMKEEHLPPFTEDNMFVFLGE